jgi:hypothetical protein
MPEDPPVRRSHVGAVVLIVLGSVLGLFALALLAGGGGLLWADQTQRDAAGYFTSSSHSLGTGSYALTHEGTKIDGLPRALDAGKLAKVRIRATSENGGSVFVGIARAHDVDAYLAGVAHAQVVDFDVDPFRTVYASVPGSAAPAPPAAQRFWVASASGEGPQTVRWPVREGTWSVVVMNADASRGIAADIKVGAKIGYLGWIWGGLLVAGMLFLGVAVLLIVVGVRRTGGGSGAPVGAAGDEPALAGGAYPLVLTARLDEPLSRWLWLVKWALLIPHWIVLGLLWLAFFVLTVFAWFAILFTGRYPRGIFDFNVGVLRWTWRVQAYGYGGLFTDRYPPFSLERDPSYPASLEVAYPGELSRGLIFVKWLLAVPHLLLVSVFVGGGVFWVSGTGGWHVPFSAGLVGLLALFAGFAVLFTSRYPRGMWELVVGFQRWVFRVAAYVALMTDEYPPFDLDRGGDEPEKLPAAATAAP